jgi:ankyrin repeat protein
MWAAANRHPEVVAVLLAGGAEVDARSEAWSQVMGVPPHSVPENTKAIPYGGNTALLFAARSGDLESARLLVSAGADVNAADAWGVSAASLAAFSGFTDLALLLLEHGADPNLDTSGFTALHSAIMRRDERMVSALLDRGADPNAPLETWTPTRRGSMDFHYNPAWVGASPLWLAARFSPPGVLRLLLEHGADPLIVHTSTYYREADDIGSEPRTEVTTALMAVLGLGGGGRGWVLPDPEGLEAATLEAVKLLVGLGVDVNAANANGRTAFDAATALRFDSVAEFLVQNGANSGAPPPAADRSSQ